jgi:hypothetical protein
LFSVRSISIAIVPRSTQVISWMVRKTHAPPFITTLGGVLGLAPKPPVRTKARLAGVFT